MVSAQRLRITNSLHSTFMIFLRSWVESINSRRLIPPTNMNASKNFFCFALLSSSARVHTREQRGKKIILSPERCSHHGTRTLSTLQPSHIRCTTWVIGCTPAFEKTRLSDMHHLIVVAHIHASGLPWYGTLNAGWIPAFVLSKHPQ